MSRKFIILDFVNALCLYTSLTYLIDYNRMKKNGIPSDIVLLSFRITFDKPIVAHLLIRVAVA